MPVKKKTIRKTAVKSSPIETEVTLETPKSLPKISTTTLLFVLVILLSGFSLFLFQKIRKLEQSGIQQAAGGQEQPRPQELKIKKPDKSEHWRGDKNARYVWVEYSDYECPFCKKNHPDLIKLLDTNKDKLAWVYRHYPLSFHANAQKEAEATECAAEQGGNDAFWKYSDLIFERTTANGTGFALSALAPLASEIGLDQVKFQECLDSGKYEKKVKDQFEEGSKAGVQATPTGVIYDTKTGKTSLVEGALPYEDLKKELDDFIAKNK